MARQCASSQRFPPKGISNQLAVFFTKIPYSCSTKMRTQVLKELLCPPTRENPRKHIWDMVALSTSLLDGLQNLDAIKQKCKGVFCTPLHFCLMASKFWRPSEATLKSSSFELFWRDVFFWNGLNGGRFGIGATGEK